MNREVFKRGALTLAILLSLSHSAAQAKDRQAAIVRSPATVGLSGTKVTVTLAPAVEQALHGRFPGLHVAGFGDFSPDVTYQLTENQSKPFAPFVCVGDFDGNGLPDVALLLKNGHRQWFVVALHQTRRGTFCPYRVRPKQGFPRSSSGGSGGRLYFFIEALPLEPDFRKAHHLKQGGTRDGIHGVWDEAASRLYYFRNGVYRYVQTSD